MFPWFNYPPHLNADEVQISHPQGTNDSQMPVGCPRGDVEASISSAHKAPVAIMA